MLGQTRRGGLWVLALCALVVACDDENDAEGAGAAPPEERGEAEQGLAEKAPVEDPTEPDAADDARAEEGSGHAPPPRRGLGTMTGRVPGTTEVIGGIRLVAHRVRAVVQDGFARTEIEEEWVNDTSRVLEGRFVFPLPPGATVTRLGLWVGHDLIEGEVVERGRASRIFRGIVEETVRPRDPALLEWVRGGEVSMTIFPIPAKGSRKVILAYDEVLEPRNGRTRWMHALSLGAERAVAIDDFSVSVRVLGADGGAITTPGWSAHVRQDDGRAEVDFAATGFVPSRDFTIELPASEENGMAEVALSAPERLRGTLDGRAAEGSDRRFFAVRIPVATPQGIAAHRSPSARVLVLDTSEGQSVETLRAQVGAAFAAADALGDDARLAVLACDSTCTSYPSRGLVRAADVDGEALAAFVGALRPRGASDLAGAVVTAARRLETGGQVVLLHDGQATAGEIATDRIADRVAPVLEVQRADLRIVGVGRTLDEIALAGLARAVGAAYEPLAGPGSLALREAAMVEGLGRPVIEGAHLELPEGWGDVVPAVLPSVRLGDAVTVLGTLAEGVTSGTARLVGTVDGEAVALEVALSVPEGAAPNPLLSRLWADRAIAAIDAEGGAQAKKRIVALSQEHHVLSRHTSFLVLENERMFAEFGVERTTLRPEDQADQAFGGADGLGSSSLPGQGSGSGQGFGSGHGFGRGHGRLAGAHQARAPMLRMGHTMVSGRLPPEVVQRIVRMQMGRFRACYERGLVKNPDLAGRVTARFVIGRTGQVISTADGGSDLPDPEVVACVVRNFAALEFPQPEGGIITVTYPIVFASDGTRPQVPPPLWPLPRTEIRAFVARPEPVFPRSPWQSPYTIVVTHAAGDDRWRAEHGDELARLGELSRSAPQSRGRRERWVRALLGRGRFDAATEQARAFVDVDPDLAVARELLAMSSAATGEREAALAAVEAIAEADARSLDAHVRAARALDASGDVARACAHHRTVAELRPEAPARARAERCWATLEGRDATRVDATEAAAPEPGAASVFLATVTCDDPAIDCPEVGVLTPAGRVVTRAAPFGAEPVPGGVALTSGAAGGYRTILLRGDAAARGSVRVRAHGNVREVAFGGQSPRTVLRTTIEEQWRPRVVY